MIHPRGLLDSCSLISLRAPSIPGNCLLPRSTGITLRRGLHYCTCTSVLSAVPGARRNLCHWNPGELPRGSHRIASTIIIHGKCNLQEPLMLARCASEGKGSRESKSSRMLHPRERLSAVEAPPCLLTSRPTQPDTGIASSDSTEKT